MSLKNNYKLLAAGYMGMTFFGVTFFVMGAVLPSLIQKLSLTTAQASTLVGLLPVGVLAGSLLFGPLSDKYGYKSVMILSSIISVIGLETLAFGNDTFIIRGAILLIGLGGGMINGETNLLVSDSSTDSSRSSNLSILGIFYCVGAICIPLLIAFLQKHMGYTPIVASAGILMFLTIFYYLFIKFPERKIKEGFPIDKMVSLAKEPILLTLALILFFQSGLEGITNNWTAGYLEIVHGISSHNAMLSLSFVVVGIAFGRILLSILSKKFSTFTIIVTSMLIYMLGMAIINLLPSEISAIISSFIIGAGISSTFPLILSEVGERYKEFSGTAFSVVLVIGLSGNAILNFVLGLFNLNRMPLLTISCALLVLIITLIYKNLKKD